MAKVAAVRKTDSVSARTIHPVAKRSAQFPSDMVTEAIQTVVLVLGAAVITYFAWDKIGGWEPMVDEVWVVIVDPDTAVARATARDGVEEDAVRKRIAAQLSNEERRAKADVVIDNSGDEASLLAQLDEQWSRIA